MPSTLRGSIWTGASGSQTAATAETGIKFNKDTTATGTTPIPIPTSAGTNFSFHKVIGLEVTANGSTTISNRRIHHASGLATGLEVFWRATATYTQAAAAASDVVGTDGSDPAGYTLMTTSAAVYDSASAASTLGLNGQYVFVAVGVSSTYAGGANSAASMPTITLTYDEA